MCSDWAAITKAVQNIATFDYIFIFAELASLLLEMCPFRAAEHHTVCLGIPSDPIRC